MNPVTVTIPIRTNTGLNARENRFARARRVRGERKSTFACLHAFARKSLPLLRAVLVDKEQLAITLTRCSPATTLADDDNVPGGLKAVRDEIAAWLGIDDGDRRLSWRYAQRIRSPWAVEVRFEAVSQEVSDPLAGLVESAGGCGSFDPAAIAEAEQLPDLLPEIRARKGCRP